LNSHELWPQIQYEVVSLAIAQGLEDADAELDGCACDRSLGNRALLVSREHHRQSSLRIGQR